jgi:hypothetical protein
MRFRVYKSCVLNAWCVDDGPQQRFPFSVTWKDFAAAMSFALACASNPKIWERWSAR